MKTQYIVGFLNILFNYLTYNYLDDFERLNCKCSMNVKRDISKVMILSFYVIIFGKMMFPDIPKTANLAIILYTLIFDIVFVSYIFELKESKCLCDDRLQNTTTSVIYIYYLLLSFMIISTIFMLLLSITTLNMIS